MKITVNFLLACVMYFALLFLEIALEYFGLLNLGIDITYNVIALTTSSVFLTISNFKVIQKRGLVVGLVSSISFSAVIYTISFMVSGSNLMGILKPAFVIPVILSTLVGSLISNFTKE